MSRLQFQNPLSLLKNRLSDPELLQSYVGAGIAITNFAVAPLTRLLKHLLVIQGIDPNTQPGAKARKLFQQAVDESFGGVRKDYDDDFDFSWVNKKFQQTRGELKDMDLSKEDFMKMTDVGNLKATQALDVNQITPNDVTHPVPLTIDESPLDQLDRFLNEELVNQISPEPEATRENKREQRIQEFLKERADTLHDGTNSIKDALVKLVMISKSLEDEELNRGEVQKLVDRTDELKNVKKAIDQHSEANVRPSGNRVARIKTGNTKAVRSPKKSLNKSTLKRNLQKAYEDYKVKLPEAQRLTRKMVARGLCSSNKQAFQDQVDEIMKFNEASFASLERVIDRRPVIKSTQERHADGRFKGNFTRSPRR
jgi:hypothetical protein